MDQADFTVAGVETVSDVQIKHSPELRQELSNHKNSSPKWVISLITVCCFTRPDYVKLAGRTVKNYKTYLKPDWPEDEFSHKLHWKASDV